VAAHRVSTDTTPHQTAIKSSRKLPFKFFWQSLMKKYYFCKSLTEKIYARVFGLEKKKVFNHQLSIKNN